MPKVPNSVVQPALGFYEFFAGGGMARIGLGTSWKCLFSNDFDPKKTGAYQKNFPPANELHFGDVGMVKTSQLPAHAALAWASFPCQDLSLAGNGKGLSGDRSGAFWSFWKLIKELRAEKRHPRVIALENVAGLITSHNGEDLKNLVSALAAEDYRVGAMQIDGALFVAQSRPRLFIIAVCKDVIIPSELFAEVPNPLWHPKSLQNQIQSFEATLRDRWIWWNLPSPERRPQTLIDVIEENPQGVSWHSAEETKSLLNMMSEANLAKVDAAKRMKHRQVGALYKRTRNGLQRAEIRFDGLSGCLRTPSGGSSRQIIMVVEGGKIRTRLISPRETARLMGLPDTYKLPEKYNEAYHLTGDGVVVPAVSWIERNILKPLATQPTCRK